MLPVSFSATAMQTFEECPARYKAEIIERPPGREGGPAANLGTAVHGALEDYVQYNFFDNTPVGLKQLIMFYKVHFDELFDTRESDEDWFGQGLEMVERWHQRTTFEGKKVLSAEKKEFFEIKTSVGPIPFNYIWDRCDQYDDGGIEIVDYKTIRQPVTPSGLKDKIQARCYGLAAQIKYPEAPYVWVTFDLLRYDAVGVRFTRDENIATWKYLRAKAEEILAMDDAPERLNANCMYCIRKGACATLNTVAINGDPRALNGSQAADRLAKIQYQIKALKMYGDSLESVVMKYAEDSQVFEWETENSKVAITQRQTRTADMSRVAQIIGPELAVQCGSITISTVDRLLKSDDLDSKQKADLRSIITLKSGAPTVKVTPLNPIDE